MGDSIPNFDDLSSSTEYDTGLFDTGYTGLSDTGEGFTGSSTLQEVQLGSPLLLDSSYGENTDVSVLDLDSMGGVSVTGVPIPPAVMVGQSQSLSGISNPPIGSQTQSTPTPNVADPNASSFFGVSALSKFGASIASIWAAPATTHAGAQPTKMTPAGGALVPGGASGVNTIILVVVVGALILLLLRSED
jgi:hypothetical protein